MIKFAKDISKMKNKALIIDAFVLKNKYPFLTFKMVVRDGIIISITNEGLVAEGEKTGTEAIGKYLNIIPLSKLECYEINGQLNFKFKLFPLSLDYFYLNLTQQKIKKLSKQDSRFQQFARPNYIEKLFKKSFNGFWVWIGRLTLVVTIITSPYPFLKKRNNQKSISDKNSNITSHDSIRNDSIRVELDTIKQKTHGNTL